MTGPAAFARGGGGHSFSTGHSSSRGGGGGNRSDQYRHDNYSHDNYNTGGYGGSGLGGFYPGIRMGGYGYGGGGFLPTLIVILLIIFILISINRARRTNQDDEEDAQERRSRENDSASELLHRARIGSHEKEAEDDQAFVPSFDAAAVREIDPHFSVPAFLDFVYALYGTLHKSRGENSSTELSHLSIYFSPKSLEKYQSISETLSEVKGVVIGSLQIVSHELKGETLQIIVNFQANYTESYSKASPGKPDQSFYSEERWLLQKKKNVLSAEPSKIKLIACPSCGAPPSLTDDGKCSSCGGFIKRGDFTWSIEEVEFNRNQIPRSLTTDASEDGSDLPTVYAHDLIQKETVFANRHPEFKFSQFKKQAEEVFFAIQKAWTEKKWELARPYESENIFQMHSYWISEYEKQGLINELKDITLQKIEAVKVDQDLYYESMTVRMFARMIDYTANAKTGKILTGDPKRARSFTEYWTFIRSVKSEGAKKFDSGCPACGAPLKINPSGHCDYCQALVTSGDFDWILSEIEQDETYKG